jgi:hypothetical protein
MDQHCPVPRRQGTGLSEESVETQQQERNRTWRQGKETARVPEEDESAIDWDAVLDKVFPSPGVRNPRRNQFVYVEK